MDSRIHPRTKSSRRLSQRPTIEHDGNLVRLRFDKRPDPVRMPTTGWYHAEAIREEAEHSPT